MHLRTKCEIPTSNNIGDTVSCSGRNYSRTEARCQGHRVPKTVRNRKMHPHTEFGIPTLMIKEICTGHDVNAQILRMNCVITTYHLFTNYRCILITGEFCFLQMNAACDTNSPQRCTSGSETFRKHRCRNPALHVENFNMGLSANAAYCFSIQYNSMMASL